MITLKIALVHKQYIYQGGTERDFVDLSYFLANNGHEVHIYTSFIDEKLCDSKINYHKVAGWGKHFGIDKFIFAKSSFKEIKKNKFDIIQTFSRLGYGDVIRIGGGCHDIYLKHLIDNIENDLYKYFKKFKHKISISDNFTRFYEKKDFANNYSKIIAISKQIKKEIKSEYDVSEEDIEINYNGVDIDKFNPKNRNIYREEIMKKFNLKNSNLNLLFLGSGFKRKGLDYVFESIKDLKSINLLVVGKGNISKYKTKAEKMGISSKVIFVGPVEKVEKYYAGSDAFIFPTIYEPFGKVITEAMASGLPVITTEIAGASELIDNQKDGFVIDKPEDVNTIQHYISLLYNESYRNEVSKAARRKAEKYSLENYFQNYLDIYKCIL